MRQGRRYKVRDKMMHGYDWAVCVIRICSSSLYVIFLFLCCGDQWRMKNNMTLTVSVIAFIFCCDGLTLCCFRHIVENPELDKALLQGEFEFRLPVHKSRLVLFHFYNSCSGRGDSWRRDGRYNRQYTCIMLLCAWLFVRAHAIASLAISSCLP